MLALVKARAWLGTPISARARVSLEDSLGAQVFQATLNPKPLNAKWTPQRLKVCRASHV